MDRNFLKSIDIEKYYTEIGIEQHKSIALKILCAIDEFCKKHNIVYHLSSGTLIGAVRHKGFIPWDDDIDIQMTRNDHDRFVKLFNEEMTNTDYRVITMDDEHSKHTHTKVFDLKTIKVEKGVDYSDGFYLGVDVDIFIIDGQAENENQYRRDFKKKKILYYALMAYNTTYTSWKWRLLKLFVRAIPFVNVNVLKQKIKEEQVKYKFGETSYAGSNCSIVNVQGNRAPIDAFKETIELEFEGFKFLAPKGYDVILRNLFGDYMTPPPKEKQVTNHFHHVYVLKNEQNINRI